MSLRGHDCITAETPVQANRSRVGAMLALVSCLVVRIHAADADMPWNTVDPSALRSGIRLAGAYLARVCDSNGRFEYVRNADPLVRPKPSYNILRHAGAMYALADYYRWSSDPLALAAMERAAGFMRSRCIKPIEGVAGALAVWSGAAIDGDFGSPRAKLGGAGLGLVGLASLESLRPNTVPRMEMEGIGRFILFLQREDGFFVKGFNPSKGGKDEDWQSLFYPGEAVLGLCMLSEIDGDKRWLNAALRGLRYLSVSRKGEKTPPADHWALIATARLLTRHPETTTGDDKALLLSHARQITEGILADQDATYSDPALRGAWDMDGRTTPTAVRLEGLLAMMEVVPKEDAALRQAIEGACARGIGFLLRSQVRDGILVGGIPKSARRSGPGADPMAAEVRIDYVQHALSAFLAYAKHLRILAQ